MSCPRCGGIGFVVNGVYSAISESVLVLSKLRPTARDLGVLAEIVRKAQARDSAPEEVTAEIQDKLPELSSLNSYFPKTRNEFYTFLNALAAMLAVFVAVAVPLLLNNQGLTKEQVEEITNRAIMNATGEKTTKQFESQRHRKTGRNEPCPCGSGKKYKKCCLNSSRGAVR